MLFNSIDFAVFLPIVFLLYWWVGGKSVQRRNVILLVASYVFYGWWDARFLVLIAFSTLVDYFVGIGLERTMDPRRRKHLLWTSLAINLGLLGYFKYTNFFLESFVDAFSLFGADFHIARLNIILPVGISFYTFQTLSYSIDVYKRKLQPTRDIIAFSTYVSFFPQLVAGPIERATNLLPQFKELRTFNYARAIDGTRQILWGLFKKMVIADNCAVEVDHIFANYTDSSGATLLLGIFWFAMQLYGDFSGYSDIAIGCARLFGFDLMKNFAFPYFSRDIAEFWQRWHISLTTWFRDYIFFAMGSSRGRKGKSILGIFIIFLVSGLWHGPAWHFVLYGGIHAVFLSLLFLRSKRPRRSSVVAKGKLFPTPKEVWLMGSTFFLNCMTGILFRSRDMDQAMGYWSGMVDMSLFEIPFYKFAALPWLVVFFMAMEWIGREHEHALERFASTWPRILRWGGYATIIALIGMFMNTEETPFIYFQF